MKGALCGLLLVAACGGGPGGEVPAFAEQIPGGAVLVMRETHGEIPLLEGATELGLSHGRTGELQYWFDPKLEVGWRSLAESPSFALAWSRQTPAAGQDWLYLDSALAVDLLRERLRAEGTAGVLALRVVDACGIAELGPLLLAREGDRVQGWLGTGTSRLAALFRGRQAPAALSGIEAEFELSLALAPDVALGIVDSLLEGTGGGSAFAFLLQAMPLRILSDVRGLLAACDGTLWLRIDGGGFAAELGIGDRDSFEDLLDRVPARIRDELRRASEWREGGRVLRLASGPASMSRPEGRAPAGVFATFAVGAWFFRGEGTRKRVEVRWSGAGSDGFRVEAEAR